MRDLFDQLQSDGEAGILRLVADRVQESVTLDFKLKAGSAPGQFGKEDKSILGEVLSGFANSAGGLAVWGIDARKGDDGVDCAQDVVPIDDIERFQSEAQTLVGQLIIPRHDGIHLAHVAVANGSAGYLLVYVERSERRPHRCEAAGKKQYFKRAGDSFFAMEHYDIEDAFYRTGKPKLSLEYKTSGGGLIREHNMLRRIIQFNIVLRNTGTATAKFPYVQVGYMHGLIIDTPGSELGFRTAGAVEEWTTFAGGVDNVIHPGQGFPALRFRADHQQNGQGQSALGGPFGSPMRIDLALRAGCENAQVVEVNIAYSHEEILRLLHQMGF